MTATAMPARCQLIQIRSWTNQRSRGTNMAAATATRTHGPIAMVVLPLVLTGIMVVWDRAFRHRPGRRHTPVNAGWLFVIALIAAVFGFAGIAVVNGHLFARVFSKYIAASTSHES